MSYSYKHYTSPQLIEELKLLKETLRTKTRQVEINEAENKIRVILAILHKRGSTS